MDRKQFIKQCGFACLGTGLALVLLEGCATGKSISGKIMGSDLSVPLSSFLSGKGGKEIYRKYIIVEHGQLRYPIYVFRFSESEYSAVLMQCTHQGAELQAFGDILQCPAHGSEFNNKGQVQNGPARESLRSFSVNIVNDQLNISLKHA
ncbi:MULTISPECIES: Rieske (2Fe-2S) protein [Sphingobacterium]|uniref:Rieske domain-containing protein n=1 Tax=Sphingobacterium cellulitidis TaxID=1768011 RepID=A0A8H9FYY1_9SPHI|nr:MULTISPECIES: Rieske (2Fe-2S) protein [Sphingobacterium]MBA8986333.1 Rieske Fe-S protein [Sphingobacterium soli]WGQ12820.1 Rieske (2Fe-2S) protein [Sphingobacterium faecium]GGE19340.1 hypothetical protein GCM10011516_16330 [Sphingobacterium soli]